MAQIPLSQIPNAPDLASMSAPQLNNVNLPNVDFGGERAAVATAYAGARENPNNAGFVGKAIAGVGDEVAKVSNNYIKQQQELNGIAGKAQFEALNSQVMDDVSSNLDPTQPHTWMGQFNQKWKQVTDWYASQPQDVQRSVYPDLLRSQYGNMASIGISAHKTDIANKTASTMSQVEQMASSGLYDDAKSLTDGLMHSGAIPIDKKNEVFRAIDSYKTDASATSLIAQDPSKAADIFARAAKAGDFTNAPDWMKGLQPKELENYAKKAESVNYYRETDKGMVVYDAINQGKIKTMEQLEGADVYKILTPDWKASAKNKLLNEVVSGSPEGIKAVGDAYGSLNAFRVGKVDTLAKDYHDMKLIGSNLPTEDSKNFLKEVDDIFQKRSEHGGSLPYDQQIKTSVSAELHKMYKDGGFGDPSSQEALSAYKQAESDWNKVTAQDPHSYAEAEAKYWQTQKNAAAAAALQKGPAPKPKGVLDTIFDAMKGSKPQASADGFQPIGDKVKSLTKSPGVNDAVYSTWDSIASKFSGITNEGIWGDEAHQKRKSDHNTGDALDIGVPSKIVGSQIKDELVSMASSQPIKYIIHNGQIWNAQQGWHPYHGSNPHEGHVHVSFYRGNKPQIGITATKPYTENGRG
jgi:hypothetical protein